MGADRNTKVRRLVARQRSETGEDLLQNSLHCLAPSPPELAFVHFALSEVDVLVMPLNERTRGLVRRSQGQL